MDQLDSQKHVIQVPLHPDKYGEKFITVFNDMLDIGYIVLGLYRTESTSGKALSANDQSEDTISYVQTAPPPDTQLHRGDQLVLLTRDANEFVDLSKLEGYGQI